MLSFVPAAWARVSFDTGVGLTIGVRCSFDHVGNWVKDIANNVERKVPWVLVGSKCDLDHLRVRQTHSRSVWCS